MNAPGPVTITFFPSREAGGGRDWAVFIDGVFYGTAVYHYMAPWRAVTTSGQLLEGECESPLAVAVRLMGSAVERWR